MRRLDGSPATDVLLMVDLLEAFDHEDGERLLASFRSRADGLVASEGFAAVVPEPSC
jgi:hypothetical protein